MTARPPVLAQDLVDRLRTLARPGTGAASLPRRTLGKVVRPLRRVVVRLVDPSLQATLEEIRREAAAVGPPGAPPPQPEVEVLRAELATTQNALIDLGRRLDEIERRTDP